MFRGCLKKVLKLIVTISITDIFQVAINYTGPTMLSHPSQDWKEILREAVQIAEEGYKYKPVFLALGNYYYFLSIK